MIQCKNSLYHPNDAGGGWIMDNYSNEVPVIWKECIPVDILGNRKRTLKYQIPIW